MAEQRKITIKELDKTFKNLLELTQYVVMQNKALLYATDRIKELEKAKEQKAIIAPSSSSITTIVRSIPEAICQLEIGRLMDKAAGQPLDWEDTKKLDVLIKNYYLSKDKESGKEEKPRPKNIILTDEDLTRLATPKNDG